MHPSYMNESKEGQFRSTQLSTALKMVSKDRKRLMMSRYSDTAAHMYSSYEKRLIRLSVSYTMYPQNMMDAKNP